MVTKHPEPDKNKIKILVAEDDKINQSVITGLLKKFGYGCTIVENGRLAVEAVKSGNYNLIFMDIQMPVMDGYEATRKIREQERENLNVIVALTANVSKKNEELSKAVGMNDFLTKPIQAEKLKGIIEKWSGGLHTETSEPHREEQGLTEVKVFDKDSFLPRVANDLELANEVLGAFKNDFDGYLKKLGQAFKSKDYEKIQIISHRLKGAAGNLSANQIHEFAKEIEVEAKQKICNNWDKVELKLKDQNRNFIAKIKCEGFD